MSGAGDTPAFHSSSAGRQPSHAEVSDGRFDRACEEALDAVLAPFLRAYEAPGPWDQRLRAALTALLATLAERPQLGRLCLLDSQVRQPDRRTYRRAVAAVAAALRGARAFTATAQEPSPRGEELLAAGAVALIAAQLAAGPPEELLTLAPRLFDLLLAPLELEAASWPIPALLD
jgi:hypothetical protein